MKEELLRLRNICLPVREADVLHGLNLTISAGEILGVYGTSTGRRGALAALLSGEAVPRAGSIFIRGKGYSDLKEAVMKLPPSERIGTPLRQIPKLRVWENLLMLRASGTKSLLRPISTSVRRYLKAYIQDIGVTFDAEDILGELTVCERYIVSLISADLLGKKLIILEDSLPNLPPEEMRELKRVLRLMASRGCSFVITSCYMRMLELYCDRISVLSTGRIVRSIHPPYGEQSARLVPLRMLHDRERPRDWKLLGTMRLELEGGQELELRFGEGKRITVFDMSGRVEAALAEARRHPEGMEHCLEVSPLVRRECKKRGGRLFAEFSSYGYLSRAFTLQENLVLGLYRRFSRGLFVSRRKLRYLRREFDEWYGSDELMSRPDCGSLLHQEELRCISYKMRLVRPRMLLFSDAGSGRDSAPHRVLEGALEETVREGGAVCVISPGIEVREDMADEYILVLKDVIRYHIPREEMASRFGWNREETE